MLEMAEINKDLGTFIVDDEVFPVILYKDYEELMRLEKKIDENPISADYTEKDKAFDLHYQHMITMDVLRLLRTFEKQGHSGFSAPLVAEIFMQRVKQLPLSPLTGEDDEWHQVDESTEQNIRCSKVFRDNHDNSTAHCLRGRMFREPNSEIYFSCNPYSLVSVTFPCNPSTLKSKFYVLKYPMEDEGEHSLENQFNNHWYEEEN